MISVWLLVTCPGIASLIGFYGNVMNSQPQKLPRILNLFKAAAGSFGGRMRNSKTPCHWRTEVVRRKWLPVPNVALTSFKRLWRNLAAGSFGGCMRNCKPLKHFLLLLASFFPHILLALQLSSFVCFFLLRLAPSYCLQMDKKQHPCCW